MFFGIMISKRNHVFKVQNNHWLTLLPVHHRTIWQEFIVFVYRGFLVTNGRNLGFFLKDNQFSMKHQILKTPLQPRRWWWLLHTVRDGLCIFQRLHVQLQCSCLHEYCQVTHQASRQPQPPLHSTTVESFLPNMDKFLNPYCSLLDCSSTGCDLEKVMLFRQNVVGCGPQNP